MSASPLRTMVLSIGIAAAVLGTACGPATADDRWRDDHRDRREHREHERPPPRYVQPPVVVAPPPQEFYQPPPIVVTQPPSGINIILPLNF